MKKISFEVDPDFLISTIKNISEKTSLSETEIERGLVYMIGRRAASLLQKMEGGIEERLIDELKIAILHSSEEK